MSFSGKKTKARLLQHLPLTRRDINFDFTVRWMLRCKSAYGALVISGGTSLLSFLSPTFSRPAMKISVGGAPAPAVYYSIEGRLKVLEQNWKILKRHLLAIIFNQRSLHSCKTLKTTQKLQKNALAYIIVRFAKHY